ncbi:undecaprenyl-diphosphatase UppP [Patescibacteria group bacterium]
MNILTIILLSIIEGITEFLPISSTGHLILTSTLLKIAHNDITKHFEIFIQLGAISAVILYYWNYLLKHKNLWKTILIGFLPVACVGFVYYEYITAILFEQPLIILSMLFLGGIVLVFIEKIFPDKQITTSLHTITPKQAIIIGLFQILSIIPGVSRAASTIVGGMIIGLDRKTTVEFSFLLAIPTIAGAVFLDIVKADSNLISLHLFSFSLGFFISFITALFVIKYFLRFISHHSLSYFGYYRIILSILFWIVISA